MARVLHRFLAVEPATRLSAFQRSSLSGTIREVQLRSGRSRIEPRLAQYAATSLQRQLRCSRIRLEAKSRLPELTVALVHWQHSAVDIAAFDRLFDKVASEGDFRLVLWSRDWLDGVQPALEVLNRYQRLLPLPIDYRPLPCLGEVLNARRLLTGSHSGQDTWRWLLRLDPRPSVALELAALFEEELAPGVPARAVSDSLGYLGFPRQERLRATELATRCHAGERSTPELQLLGDARDLCFFSNQTWHLRKGQGSEAVLARVRSLLGRMTPRAVCLALATRQPPDVSSMIEQVLDEDELERAPDSGIRRA